MARASNNAGCAFIRVLRSSALGAQLVRLAGLDYACHSAGLYRSLDTAVMPSLTAVLNQFQHFCAFAAFAVLGVLAAAGRTARAAGVWTGVWLAWAILGLLVSWTVSGASYLFVLPTLVAGLAGWLLGPDRRPLAALLPLAVAGVLWAPLALLLFAGLGTPGIVVIAVVFGLIAMPLAPLLADARRPALWVGAIALIGLVAAFLVPSTTRASASRKLFTL